MQILGKQRRKQVWKLLTEAAILLSNEMSLKRIQLTIIDFDTKCPYHISWSTAAVLNCGENFRLKAKKSNLLEICYLVIPVLSSSQCHWLVTVIRFCHRFWSGVPTHFKRGGHQQPDWIRYHLSGCHCHSAAGRVSPDFMHVGLLLGVCLAAKAGEEWGGVVEAWRLYRDNCRDGYRPQPLRWHNMI